jgi:hypothetical protein
LEEYIAIISGSGSKSSRLSCSLFLDSLTLRLEALFSSKMFSVSHTAQLYTPEGCFYGHNNFVQLKYVVSADDQIPWLGAGVGIIMGVIIVVADHILTHKPMLVVSAFDNSHI